MWTVKYGNEYLHDPRIELILPTSQPSVELNTSTEFEFEVAIDHPLYNTIRERDQDNPVIVYQDDEIIYKGEIIDISLDFQLTKKVTCKSDLNYFNGAILRPYSTLASECDRIAPATVNGYFEFLVDEYNKQASDARKFKIGVNEGGSLDSNNYIYRSDSTYPTVGSVISDKIIDSLGGYIRTRHEADGDYVDLLSDMPDVNAQLIDFGVNLLDFTKDDSSDDVATFVIPLGKSVTKLDDNQDEISLNLPISYDAVKYLQRDVDSAKKSLDEAKENLSKATDDGKADAQKKVDEAQETYDSAVSARDDAKDSVSDRQLIDGYFKSGDIIYSEKSVNLYGWIGTKAEFSEVGLVSTLISKGLTYLKSLESPVTTIECTALDLSMIKPDLDPIKLGDYVRVRSKPHNIDSYYLLTKIEYDLNNPENNKFTLGTTFDTLTGQQNKRINALNATINTVYEAADRISAEAKASAIVAGEAQETANSAQSKADEANAKADEAQSKADEAQTKADEAQKKADEAQSKADSAVSDAKDAADKAADAAKKADDATANITLIQNRITTIEGNTAEAIANAAAAKEAADSAKADAEAANTAASNAQSAAESAQSKADEAYTAAGNAQSQVGKINEEITGIKQNAADLRDDLEGRIETVTNTMTADYAKKTDLSSVESSLKTEISTSAAGIRSEVSQNYATKTELNSIQVGGRNLVLDSKVEATSAAYGFGVRSLSISLEPNTEYIFSINGRTNDDKTSDDGKHLLTCIYSTDWAWSESVSISETSDTTRSVSFTTPDNISSKTINIESFYYPSKADSGVTPAGTCTVNWYKLEKGNKATDWTPAPEDVDSSIADLANNVETNYSTKSEVKQLSDQITSTVSSVEEVKVTAAAAQKTASDAATAAANAQSAADVAKTNASNAQSAADAAKTAADTAQSKADEAATNLATAEKNLQDLQSQANATDEQLTAAQTAVANAKKAADAAQSAADTAKANAETAQSTADTAKENAATAQTTANTAKTAAEKAQSDVDSLKNRVTTAETKINQNAEAITLRATKTEVSEVKSTADTAKSTADTVKTNLANNYSTTTQMNAAIKTSADSITSTVSKTYQVKGDYATNSSVKNTLRTYSFAAASGNNNHWTHIGDWQSNDNNSCHVIVYSGNGYNAGTNQNSVIDIFIKDGWQSSGSTTSAYAATVTLDQATQNEAKVKIIATAANKCQVWLYTSWSYGYGYYTIDCHPSSTWTNVSTIQEAEPSGASQAVEYRPNAGDNAAEIEKTQTKLTQTDQEIRMDFNKSIASTSSDLQSQMDANNTAVNTKLSEINKYIRFVDGKIVLGETGNELMLTIQNDRVSFTQAGVEVAYFSNNNLYVKRAEILTTMKIGNYEFTPRNDGGLALRKRSE